jgi:hypothetical protein
MKSHKSSCETTNFENNCGSQSKKCGSQYIHRKFEVV